MNIIRTIQAFGLSETETSIYLASLELGESSITELAKKANLTRSSCYIGVQKLVSLGLVSIFRAGSKKLYRAENPDKFLTILRDREASIKAILPHLKSLNSTNDRRPALFTYQGREGFRAVLDDILEKQNSISAITSIDSAFAVLGDDFKDFIEKRFRKNLKVRLLTDKTEKSIELKKKDASELRVTKFLPSELPLSTANFIYGNRIAIVSLISKNPVCLIIEDSGVVQTYMALFEVAWSHS